MKIYFEAYSGIAGDMVIGSLLDLGASKEKLIHAINSLDIQEKYELVFDRVKKNGIDAYNFDVILETKEHEHNHKCSHGHNHEHEQGHRHSHNHECGHHNDSKIQNFIGEYKDISQDDTFGEKFHNNEHYCDNHNHDHECCHGHNHEHSHEHHHHEHSHTNLEKVYQIIDSTDLSDYVKQNAKNIFHIIAVAESKAHGVDINEVHFHEVGAVDSIIDIVGTCVLLEDLGVSEIYSSQIYEGTGFVKCAHGNMPVPVPAVINIASEHGLKINIIDEIGEHITPTGAAILANFANKKQITSYTPKKIGLGAGNKNFSKTTNILRAIILQEEENDSTIKTAKSVDLQMIETNIDDCCSEILGYLMEKLQDICLDAFYTPIYMKKNRPAYKLSVLCNKNDVAKVEGIIFRQTTTIGVRKYDVQRDMLQREIESFVYNGLELFVKVAFFENESYIYPEYESAKLLSEKLDLPIKKTYDIIINEYLKKAGLFIN